MKTNLRTRIDATFMYQTVPTDTALWLPAGYIWYVVLSPIGMTRTHMPLEIRGDVVLGTVVDDASPDVDLSVWDAQNHGVSRRHLRLRPSERKLFLVDMGSTNGTHINGLPLGRSWAYAVRSDDIVSLGRLHIRVRIVQRP
ncbi:MAG: FHA domain-containing protein, partial [Anaerolineae bacterium]